MLYTRNVAYRRIDQAELSDELINMIPIVDFKYIPSQSDLKYMKIYNLNLDEIKAIKIYTSAGYEEINMYLLENNYTDDLMNTVIHWLYSAVKKMGKKQPPRHGLSAGVNFPIPEYWPLTTFRSTSKNSPFDGKINIFFPKAMMYADIHEISVYPRETEHLLLPGQCYHVTDGWLTLNNITLVMEPVEYNQCDENPSKHESMREYMNNIPKFMGYNKYMSTLFKKGEFKWGWSSHVRDVDKYGRTMLHHAAAMGNPALIIKLINAGADINAKNNSGITPIMAAAYELQKKSLKVLIEHGADLACKGYMGETLLSRVTEMRLLNVKIIDAIIEQVNPDTINIADDEGMTSMHHCKDSRIQKHLISLGGDLTIRDSRGYTPLDVYLENNPPRLFKHVLTKNLPLSVLNSKDNKGVPSIFRAKTGEVMQKMIQLGTNPSITGPDGDSVLMIASKLKEPDIEHLLDLGMDPEYRNSFGETALMYAAGTGNVITALTLVKNGADVNAENVFGGTYMDYDPRLSKINHSFLEQ